MMQEAGLRVLEAVNPEVAPLAHGLDVAGDHAEWGAGAEVGHGEPDGASGPEGFLALAFKATAGGGIRAMKSALASAFAPPPCASGADLRGEQPPACRVVGPAHWHLVSVYTFRDRGVKGFVLPLLWHCFAELAEGAVGCGLGLAECAEDGCVGVGVAVEDWDNEGAEVPVVADGCRGVGAEELGELGACFSDGELGHGELLVYTGDGHWAAVVVYTCGSGCVHLPRSRVKGYFQAKLKWSQRRGVTW